MYLHIGGETIVSEQDMIGIFDLDNTSISRFTREFLRVRQQNRAVITVAEDIPKSFVVCAPPRRGSVRKKGKIVGNGSRPYLRETVYLSQLAVSTLRRRAEGNGIGDEKYRTAIANGWKRKRFVCYPTGLTNPRL